MAGLHIKGYDDLVTRLVSIVMRVAGKEMPTCKELANDFNVTVSTIQVDIFERLAAFPIIVNHRGELSFAEGFSLKKSFLTEDEMIAVMIGLSLLNDVQLFQRTSTVALSKLIMPNNLNILNGIIETFKKDMDDKLMFKIQEAINKNQVCEICFKNNGFKKVFPLKISFADELYLFGVNSFNEIFSCKISEIHMIEVLSEKNEEVARIRKTISYANPLFFKRMNNIRTIIEIDEFTEKKLLDSSLIYDSEFLVRKVNGNAIYKCYVENENDLLNLAKALFGKITILGPLDLKNKFIVELENTLAQYGIKSTNDTDEKHHTDSFYFSEMIGLAFEYNDGDVYVHNSIGDKTKINTLHNSIATELRIHYKIKNIKNMNVTIVSFNDSIEYYSVYDLVDMPDIL